MTEAGTGGLARAYGACAKQALLKAQIAIMLPFFEVSIDCEYSMYDILQKNFEQYTIVLGEVEYTDKITINFSILSSEYDDFALKIQEISSNSIKTQVICQKHMEKLLK